MGRLSGLLTGFVLGGAAMFGALKYHVVRTSDGFELVPKATATLSQTYVDVRNYTVSDWAEHRDLAMALMHADKGHVLGASTETAVRNEFNKLLDSFRK